jgi:hypothetical protein
MLVGGKRFDGSMSFFVTNRRLRSIAAPVDRFTEFHPVSFPERIIMEVFLYILFKHNMCCYLTGSFVNYAAGMFHVLPQAYFTSPWTIPPATSTISESTADESFQPRRIS